MKKDGKFWVLVESGQFWSVDQDGVHLVPVFLDRVSALALRMMNPGTEIWHLDIIKMGLLLEVERRGRVKLAWAHVVNGQLVCVTPPSGGFQRLLDDIWDDTVERVTWFDADSKR